MRKISDDALASVFGGVTRTVNTNTSQNAALRCGPGKSYEQISSLPNGTTINTTGIKKRNTVDGRMWYEINSPIHGWIAGSIIGYER